MEQIRIKSTSRSSAQCSDIVLRQKETTRLVFRPLLVENEHEPDATIKGMFVHQRKGPKEAWDDTQTIPLSNLKKGEGFKLELGSFEMLQFYKALTSLYDLRAESGIPRGNMQFVPLDRNVAGLTNLSPQELGRLLNANQALGPDLLRQLLEWATDGDDPAALVEHLTGLSQPKLRTLNLAVNLQELKAVLATWEASQTSSDEEFWQDQLTRYSFVLQQVFASPITIVKDKAFVGGKNVMNTGGKLVDFLMRNRLTKNALVVEIKTPATQLLSTTPYRHGVWIPSTDLAGSVSQVLTYKHTLQQEYYQITYDLDDTITINAFDPPCAVIIGSIKQELASRDQHRSFELFRAQHPGVTILTFDEVFSRIAELVTLLESAPEDETTLAESASETDIPF